MGYRRHWFERNTRQVLTAVQRASAGFAVLVPTHRHADVTSELIMELPHLAGNLFYDAHTAILMREHGIRQICTRDTDFNQFTFVEIIDPLRL